MQPCFTPACQVKDWFICLFFIYLFIYLFILLIFKLVYLLSILTAHLSFEYMDIKTSKKRPWTPSFLSLSDCFWQGIQSKAFLKLTKREKSKFRCFCGLDFMYLSIRIFNVKMLSTVPCIFLKPPCSAFKIPLWTILLPDKCAGGGAEGLARLELTYMNQHQDMGAIKYFPFSSNNGYFFRI